MVCPQLVLRLADHMRERPPGHRVRVIATDPLSAIDIPYFLDRRGHRLLSRDREPARIVFVIERGG